VVCRASLSERSFSVWLDRCYRCADAIRGGLIRPSERETKNLVGTRKDDAYASHLDALRVRRLGRRAPVNPEERCLTVPQSDRVDGLAACERCPARHGQAASMAPDERDPWETAQRATGASLIADHDHEAVRPTCRAVDLGEEAKRVISASRYRSNSRPRTPGNPAHACESDHNNPRTNNTAHCADDRTHESGRPTRSTAHGLMAS
jgi:hypothetical protein